MALQDLLDGITAAEADKQALVDAKTALAAAQEVLTTNQADVDDKTKAVSDAATKLANDRVTVEQLVDAELGPLPTA